MRLLIASDLHGSLDSLRFLCDTAQRLSPDMLVLLGDLVYHGPRNPLPGGYDTRSVLEELDRLNHLPCPVTAVRGNCDAEVDIMLTPFAVSENAWIEADALRIFATPSAGEPASAGFCPGHGHPARPYPHPARREPGRPALLEPRLPQPAQGRIPPQLRPV